MITENFWRIFWRTFWRPYLTPYKTPANISKKVSPQFYKQLVFKAPWHLEYKYSSSC